MMKRVSSFLLFVVANAAVAHAQAPSQPPQGHDVFREHSDSVVRRFAEQLIREYVPSDANPVEGLGEFLRSHPRLLDPSLRRAFVADTMIQSHYGEYLGPDFNLLLGIEDNCDRFDVGATNSGRDRFRVEVREMCSEVRSDTADAILLLHTSGGSFAISNIIYPRAQTDLRKVLAEFPNR